MSQFESKLCDSRVNEIYQQFSRMAVIASQRVGLGGCDIEDFISDSLLKILESKSDLHQIIANPKALYWKLVGLAKNFRRSQFRHSTRISADYDFVSKNATVVEFHETESEVSDELRAKLSCLKLEYSEILRLKLSCYSISEIAQLLNISIENAKTRLSRARKALAVLFEKEG